MLPDTARTELLSYSPGDAEDAEIARYVIDTITTHGPAALDRSRDEHLTASAFVFDDRLTSTLLCYHRKGDFWVQPGGHVDDADDSLLDAALRELAEETGISRFHSPGPRPADVDRHALGGGFGTCSWHLDIGFVVIADPSEPFAVSEESLDLAWWPLDALPSGCAPGFERRIGRVLASAASLLGHDLD